MLVRAYPQVYPETIHLRRHSEKWICRTCCPAATWMDYTNQ